MPKKFKNLAFNFRLEWWIWVFALLMLALFTTNQNLSSICLLHNLGLEWCPGCGLGRSVGYLMRGQWEASLNAHPLGWFSLLMLLHRIYILTKIQFKYIKH